jgi:hypothetical protein
MHHDHAASAALAVHFYSDPKQPEDFMTREQ